MSVGVLAPFRGGCPHRERAWAWCRPRYRWAVTEANADPWVKSEAVNAAVEAAAAEILVIADADVWCEGLAQAVAAVRAGAGWAVPHSGVYRLTQASTAAALRGNPWRDLPLTQPPYLGTAGGGYVVARRETLLEVPMDPRFVSWGQEDESHARALTTLAGPPWRGTEPLVHLWHPPQQRLSRRWGSLEGKRLARRYHNAAGNPDRMRRLLQEFTT